MTRKKAGIYTTTILIIAMIVWYIYSSQTIFLQKGLQRTVGGILFIIASILLRYKLFFLHLPNRTIIENNRIFLSPANGTIISIVDDPLSHVIKKHRVVIENAMKDTGSGSTMVSIMMTPLNVHYQRAPQGSKLIEQVHRHGKFLNAMWDKNSTFENEYNSMIFETPDHIKFKVIQIAGFLARRIVPYLQIGQSVKQGDVIGLIKMGSQVTIIFDKNIKVEAKVGDIVHEGVTVLGTVKRCPKQID